jgi:hypothetical protein
LMFFLTRDHLNKDVKHILYPQFLFYFLFDISYIISKKDGLKLFLNFTEPYFDILENK